MRVLLVSSTSLGLKALERIQKNRKVDVVGIITANKNFSISYAPGGVNNVLHADFSTFSKRHGIPVWKMNERMTEPGLFDFVQECAPESVLVVGWYHMIPKRWLETWPTFGVHASLLPKYTGGAPLVWAILNGESETGVTLFKFDQGVDSGPIVDQRKVLISRKDTISTLYDKIQKATIEMLNAKISLLNEPNLVLQVQNEKNRTTFRQRNPDDGVIDSNLSERELRDFVRAQTSPYPGAFIQIGNHRVVVWRLKSGGLRAFDSKDPLIVRRKSVFVAAINGYLEVAEFSIQQQHETKWIHQKMSRKDSLLFIAAKLLP